MLSRIDRIRRSVSARRALRTDNERPAEAEAFGARLPVPVGAAYDEPPTPRCDFRHGDNEFEAQLMGQAGERRGLRGGPLVIDTANTAYNRVEWSGRYDRRAKKGRRARTTI
jgi:hypothetical protein